MDSSTGTLDWWSVAFANVVALLLGSLVDKLVRTVQEQTGTVASRVSCGLVLAFHVALVLVVLYGLSSSPLGQRVPQIAGILFVAVFVGIQGALEDNTTCLLWGP